MITAGFERRRFSYWLLSTPRFDLPAGLWHKGVRRARLELDPRPARPARAAEPTDMAKKAQRYLNRLGLHLERARQRLRRRGFSNFDEERMLAEFVARLCTEESARVAVDVGAGDGIRGSNTYALFLQGWR